MKYVPNHSTAAVKRLTKSSMVANREINRLYGNNITPKL
jgi:hypothetical protein